MTEPRRLTAEMREDRKDELKGQKFTFGNLSERERFERDSLHDLDVLEGELDELIHNLACCPECAPHMTNDYQNGVCLPCQLRMVLDTLEERNEELAAAQATISERDAMIACLVSGHGEYPANLGEMAAAYNARIRAEERKRVIEMIADDAVAMTYQTMGQYRSALIRALVAQPEEEISNG